MRREGARMEPLDLTQRPPRPPRAELAGIVFLPRSIDKVRASLPSGKLGEYGIAGFTETMLEIFEIGLPEFTEVVRTATTDDEIATFVSARIDASKLERWHAFVMQRKPRGGNVAEAIEAYPFLAGRKELGLSLDVLAEDDAYIFSRQH